MLIFFHKYRQNPDNCAASAIDYNQLTGLLSHNFTTNNFIQFYLLSFKYLPLQLLYEIRFNFNIL